MIISASRRTDIPAFYSEWFFNRLEKGKCKVVNPFNPKQIKKVSLLPEDVDLIVFWTKNSVPMLKKLHLLDEKKIPYYFLYTIVRYGRELEPGLPRLIERVESFKKLSDKIGSERVVWRYDPILVSREFDLEFHLEMFSKIASALNGSTQRVIISFTDYYRKTRSNLSGYNEHGHLVEDPEMLYSFSEFMQQITSEAGRNNLEILSCAETIDLKSYGVKVGKCIDDELINDVFGLDLSSKKDPGQRKECKCIKSVDIGAYNTCLHGCKYCYATDNYKKAKINYEKHDPKRSALLNT